ncbi:unnamed protein product [Amoebophrya sp. A25]|nr:unnamed protein product [Amoebophrya sp. A25]|eukprot:GSA25T00022096001.1
MSRRPVETGGSLVFQEGKKIEGEYYIIAVYDDPERNTVSFCAYELETNQTYTLPYTYTELDELFRYNSELMNPTNRDARYHWIIERLDFVVALDSTTSGRKLCLAPEPTPEEEPQDKKKKKKDQEIGGGGGGKLDAATRAKLIAELDTMDDHALYISLVKSEEARKQFLTALHAKRRLEQIKAGQRSHKLDEDQELRMKKLQQQRDFIKSKAVQYQEDQADKKMSMAKMAELMNQAENEAVKKALKKKAEKKQERADWRAAKQKEREREAARARKAKELQEEQFRMLAKRRAIVQEERDIVMKQRQDEILKKRQVALDARLRLRQAKKADALAAAETLEAERQKLRDDADKKKEHFKALEEKRIHAELMREKKRNDEIRDVVLSIQADYREQQMELAEEKKRLIEEKAVKAALDARKRAMLRAQAEEHQQWRKQRALQMAEEEMKNVKEQEWLRRHDADAEKDVLDKNKEPEENEGIPIEDEEILRLKLEQRAREKRKEAESGGRTDV